MSQTRQLEAEIAAALDRLQRAIGKGSVPETGSADGLQARVAELEKDKAALSRELENLKAKRDKDVAALDDLIAQLKPLIEEV